MRKPIVLLTTMALTLGSVGVAGAAWDGGDELPTNPLNCPGEEAPACLLYTSDAADESSRG